MCIIIFSLQMRAIKLRTKACRGPAGTPNVALHTGTLLLPSSVVLVTVQCLGHPRTCWRPQQAREGPASV